jgi:hypothetical protein
MSPALAGRMGDESLILKCKLFHAPSNKSVIHDVIVEDMEIWRETFEILADKKLMR